MSFECQTSPLQDVQSNRRSNVRWHPCSIPDCAPCIVKPPLSRAVCSARSRTVRSAHPPTAKGNQSRSRIGSVSAEDSSQHASTTEPLRSPSSRRVSSPNSVISFTALDLAIYICGLQCNINTTHTHPRDKTRRARITSQGKCAFGQCLDIEGPRGVTVSTLDSESSDRGSNPREAFGSPPPYLPVVA